MQGDKMFVKLSEKDLKEEHLFLDSIIENIPNMIFVKDAKDLRFVRFNKAGEELLGFNRADLIGKNDYDFFPKDQADFFISRDRAVLNHKVLVDIPEEPIDTKMKGKRILHTKKIPILDEKGEPLYLLGISEDITDSKRIQEELKTVEELHEVDKLKSSFVTVAAHQLRTPLSGIKWTLDMLTKGELGSLTPDQKVLLEKTAESNNRLIALVDDLLGADKLNQGKFKFESKPVSLGKVVDGIFSELAPIAKRKGVELINTASFEDLPPVLGEVVHIRSIFQNLIENAIKYTPSHGKVELSFKKNPDHLLVKVADTGIGISDAEKSKIFSQFFRGENAIQVETDGTGLGLYITKVMIERHGGKIWFESSINKGTTFYFTLPLASDKI